MIAEIIGRTGEDIFLPDGKTVPWNQLKSLMNHPQVRQFQLVQEIDGSLKIKYVAESGADIGALEQLLSYRFRNLLDSSIGITTEQVSRIDPAPSGKTKLVISNYKPWQTLMRLPKKVLQQHLSSKQDTLHRTLIIIFIFEESKSP